MVQDLVLQDIKEALKFIEQEKVIVLEKTENSDLLPVGKPSDLEFFEKVFEPNGPFWSLYNELGLGTIPRSKYMHTIGGRMYFCKNVTDKYVYSVGMRKVYDFVDNKLVKKRPLNLDNILLLLLAPIDTLKHASSTIATAFKTNESLKDFLALSKEIKEFQASSDPVDVARSSQTLAISCMRFSFLSSIAYFLNVKLSDSDAWMNCELGNLVNILKDNNLEKAKSEYGFYSQSPYAISEPRYYEDDSNLLTMRDVPVPKNKYIRWRENCKFLVARCLAWRRMAYLEIGEESGLGDLVFFLTTGELSNAKNNRKLATSRQEKYLQYKKLDLPAHMILQNGKLVGEKTDEQIRGESVSVKNKISGTAIFVDTRADFEKDLDGKILISKSLKPDLVETYDRIVAVISESGGGLAHSAVIAREMNKVCIVQTKNISRINEGDLIEVDGKSGFIKITQNS